MEITVYAKKRTTKEGKTFYSYLSRLTNKRTGQDVTVAVKFRESAGYPDAKSCPMNIKFVKSDGNLTSKPIVDEETGEEIGVSNVLWVSAWEEGAPFVDDSLDDFV